MCSKMKNKQQQIQPRSSKKADKSSSRHTSPQSNHQKRSTSPETVHFASNAFLNSPDPSKLPVPDFDDDDDNVTSNDSSGSSSPVVSSPSSPCSSVMSSAVSVDSSTQKTDALKQFLNIRSQLLA